MESGGAIGMSSYWHTRHCAISKKKRSAAAVAVDMMEMRTDGEARSANKPTGGGVFLSVILLIIIGPPSCGLGSGDWGQNPRRD